MTNGWPITQYDERDLPVEPESIRQWRRTMTNAVRRTRGQLRSAPPSDPQEGEIYYTDGAWDPIGEGPGYYGYLNGQFVLLTAVRLIQGYYNQLTDTRLPQNAALDAASNYKVGDYYVITASGVFTTPIPELNGLSAVPGDRISSTGVQWVLLTGTGDFLSKRLDDTAQGVITFSVGAKSNIAPVAAEDLTRKDYSDNADAAIQSALNSHVGNTSNPHNVTAAQAGADPAGSAAAVQTDLDNHKATTNIHFPDAPSDGETYGRNNAAWVTIPSQHLVTLYGEPPNFSVGTGLTVIADYPNSLIKGAKFSGSFDPIAGTITIPETGIYLVSAHVMGEQGNSNKEESFFLWTRITGGPNAGDYESATFQVATDKTPRVRQLTFPAVPRSLEAGEVLSLALSATTGMGTFDFITANLTVSRFS